MDDRTVSRREVLHGLLLSIGYVGGLSACNRNEETGAPSSGVGTLVPRYYSPGEYSFVSRLADTLLPTTDTPGAVDAGVPAYMDALMADWASAETQEEHHRIIATVEKELAGMPLEDLDAAAFGDRREDLGAYLKLKNLIAQVYYVTEPGATLEARWVPVPGRWEHCISLEDLALSRGG